MKVALLHADLKYTDPAENLRILQGMSDHALSFSPNLIMMPELALSGYEFRKEIGTDWIEQGVAEAFEWFKAFAREHRVAVLVGSPTYDPEAKTFGNTATLIDETGEIKGWHHKISVLPGSESWAEKGRTADPIPWNGLKIGVLICADMYTETIVSHLAQQGAEVILSPANWSQGEHAPNGEWEERSKETGLTVVVCNRTGKEDEMDFRGSVSAVVVDGERKLVYDAPEAAVLCAEFDDDWRLVSKGFEISLFEME